MCLLLQAAELCSTATSPHKAHQEEQSQALTPPGKGPVAGVRSPSCGRQPVSVRGTRLHLPAAGVSGIRAVEAHIIPRMSTLVPDACEAAVATDNMCLC